MVTYGYFNRNPCLGVDLVVNFLVSKITNSEKCILEGPNANQRGAGESEHEKFCRSKVTYADTRMRQLYPIGYGESIFAPRTPLKQR